MTTPVVNAGQSRSTHVAYALMVLFGGVIAWLLGNGEAATPWFLGTLVGYWIRGWLR